MSETTKAPGKPGKALKRVDENKQVFALTIAEMKDQIAVMDKVIAECLVPSKENEADGDYGVIPGCGPKPVLLQPGGDKLCRLCGFYPDFRIEQHSVAEDFIRYLVECKLYNAEGDFMATGLGSCNSEEQKYKKSRIKENYIWPNAATAQQKADLKLQTRTSKAGKKFQCYIETTEISPLDQDNTILKIARKRAYMAAVLTATRLHHKFTQDIEDMAPTREAPTEVPVEVVDSQPAEKAKPAEQKKKGRPSGSKNKQNGEPPPPADEGAPAEAGAKGKKSKDPEVATDGEQADIIKEWAGRIANCHTNDEVFALYNDMLPKLQTLTGIYKDDYLKKGARQRKKIELVEKGERTWDELDEAPF